VTGDRAGLDEVQDLALRKAIHNIHQDHLAPTGNHGPMGDGGTDETGADNADFAHKGDSFG